jgi:hypothetical protein
MQTTPSQNQQKTLFDVLKNIEQFDDFISRNRSIVIFAAENSTLSTSYVSQLKQDGNLAKYLVDHRIDIAVVDTEKNQDIAAKERVRVAPQTIGYSESRRIGIKIGPLTTNKFVEDCLANWYGIPPEKQTIR